MLSYLYHMPNLYLFLLLCVVSVIVSIIGILIVERFIPIEIRNQENPVIGNMSSLISIIYGVLAGLTALYLINNISYASDAVQREANSVANVYRDSKWLKEPARTNIQKEIVNYLQNVIKNEWPIMRVGSKLDYDNSSTIDNIAHQLDNYSATSNSDSLILSNILNEINNLYDAREQRIHLSYSALSNELWLVLIIGTILMIGINFLFGMNFYMHVITVSAASMMAASMFFLLITLDRPFQGEFVVGPDSFQSVLSAIEKHNSTTSVASLVVSETGGEQK